MLCFSGFFMWKIQNFKFFFQNISKFFESFNTYFKSKFKPMKLVNSMKKATLTSFFSLIDEEENFFGIVEHQLVSFYQFIEEKLILIGKKFNIPKHIFHIHWKWQIRGAASAAIGSKSEIAFSHNWKNINQQFNWNFCRKIKMKSERQ